MTDLFSKRLTELTKEDIEQIIAEAVQEGSQIEFKAMLPAKAGSQDPWLKSGARIGDRARNEIVEEVIAFANAYGGTLVLGISETEEKPARAARVSPLPKCADLAERIRLQLRDCIDPQIPLVEVAGVPMDPDGAGTVVIRTPSSRMAPHRHTVTRECYVRRADRSEKMTMREIQDLSLQIDRGLAGIKTRFQGRRDIFSGYLQNFEKEGGAVIGVRATLIPLTPIFIERVHKNDAVTPPRHTLYGKIGGNICELFIPGSGGPWRPILRGTLNTQERDTLSLRREIHCDGLIEYVLVVQYEQNEKHRLYPGWVMGVIGNAICAVERFRRTAGAPEVEYGLQFEICTNCEVPVGTYGSDPYMRIIAKYPPGQMLFSTYTVGNPESFQELTALLERDFWDAAGSDSPDKLEVDYVRALRELGLMPGS